LYSLHPAIQGYLEKILSKCIGAQACSDVEITNEGKILVQGHLSIRRLEEDLCLRVQSAVMHLKPGKSSNRVAHRWGALQEAAGLIKPVDHLGGAEHQCLARQVGVH
jgi:hypothetical protein